jgi:hypothetical protein
MSLTVALLLRVSSNKGREFTIEFLKLKMALENLF